MKIAVLGSGPAGLLAAEAADSAVPGVEINIYTDHPYLQTIQGAVFLQAAIPGVTDEAPDGYIQVRKKGTREVYAAKAYNDPAVSTSWDEYGFGDIAAWDMRTAYEKLFQKWKPRMIRKRIDADNLRHLMYGSSGSPQVVISSIPLMPICRDPLHNFGFIRVIARTATLGDDYRNVMEYNGLLSSPVLRTCQAFGHGSEELILGTHGGMPITKPLANNCNCWPGMIRVGRYGRWEKGVLAHTAYYDVKEILS